MKLSTVNFGAFFLGSAFFSQANAEILPTVRLNCTNNVKFLFKETQIQEGLGVHENRVVVTVGEQHYLIHIELINTFSGRRIISGQFGDTQFRLLELADAPYWSLNVSGGSFISPKCYRQL